jgi:translation initiation factor 1
MASAGAAGRNCVVVDLSERRNCATTKLMAKDTKLVWSDDPKDQALLAPKKKATEPPPPGGSWTAVFRLEKAGRGGKTVTVIDQLPRHETFLRELCKELKSKCGSGGTYNESEGWIEIQGDKRQMIKEIFTRKAIKFKGM